MKVYLVANKSSERWKRVVYGLGALNVEPLAFSTFELNKPASELFLSYFVPKDVKLERLSESVKDPRSFATNMGSSLKINNDEIYMIMEKDSVLYGTQFMLNDVSLKEKKVDSIKKIIKEKKQVLVPYDYRSYLDLLFHIGFLFTEVYSARDGKALTDFKEDIFERFKKFFNIDKDKYIVWCLRNGMCGFKELKS